MVSRFGSGGQRLRMSSRLLLIVGLVLLLLAGGFWVHERRWKFSAEQATGTVTEMEARQAADGTVAYYPHVRFRLPGGEIVQVIAPKGGSADAFSDGEQVPVRYYAADPQRALIAPITQVYGVAITFGVVGTLLFDLGAVLWILRRRREMRRLV